MIFSFYRQFGIIYASKRTRIVIASPFYSFGIMIDMEETLISLAVALIGALVIIVAFEVYLAF